MEVLTQNLVSIVLPTFNRAEYLPRALKSVINQTYKNWEILIVDDGSEDETLNLVKNYINNDVNIKYHFHENRGAAFTMNVGMENR